MRIPRHHHRSTRGALMAAALMLMIVGGIFVTSWVTLMSTRASQVSYLETSCKRHIGIESSRLLAWQCITSKAFDLNNTMAASQNTLLGSDIGGFNTRTGWSNLNVFTSANTAGGMDTVFPFNHTGLRPGATYINVEQFARPSDTVAGNIDDYNAWQFLKTMPPVLNGDVFCIYRKPDNATTQLDVGQLDKVFNNVVHNANWTVQGRTVVRHPPSLFVGNTSGSLQLPFLTKSLYIQSHSTVEPPSISYPVYGTDLNGKALLPSNMPVVPSTTGPVDTSGASNYQGYLNVVRNDNNPDNSLWHFQDREAAAGRTPTITIDVESVFNSATEAYWIAEQATPTYPPLGGVINGSKLKVLFIKLDSQYLKNMRIYGVVDQIIFVGQSNANAFANAAALKPVIITIMPDSNGNWVRDIRFERENNRRHVLAFKNTLPITYTPPGVELSWVNNPISGTEFRWRCVLVNEYESIMYNMPATLTQSIRWIGGVMTNWTVKRRAAGGSNPSRLLFTSDSDPSVPAATNGGPAFATFLPRDAWLESYFLPVPPP